MSDSGRDGIAEGIASVFSWLVDIPGPVALVLVALVTLATLVWVIVSAFPMKKHQWCNGTGHWGIGPFRRKCGACGGSGLVERRLR